MTFSVYFDSLPNSVPQFSQDTTVARSASCVVTEDIHQCGTTIPDFSFLRVIGLPSVEFVKPLLSVKPAQEIGANVCQVVRVLR